MAVALSLEALWNGVTAAASVFAPETLAAHPAATQRYLLHAIAPGTPLASAVRLRMHGEIKLKNWLPFTAEQVIAWDRGMIWNATVRMYGIPLSGYDRLIDHEGAMEWKVLGLFPFLRAAGHDITRSSAGRVLAESVWLPSALCGENVTWAEDDATRVSARIAVEGETARLQLGVADTGQLRSVLLDRWGNPDGGEYGYLPFGGVAEQERTFGGYTIPTRLRVGWHFGTPRFDMEGEFFRCCIDHAAFR